MRSERPAAPFALKLAAWGAVAFLHIPLALIVLYAFSAEDKSYVFPPPALTTHWFGVAWQRDDVWAAIRLSFEVAAVSTAIALVLGTFAAAALARARFFGRDAISLLLVLPIALPGIISGISLRSAYHTLEIPFSFWTIVIGHATFCVVVVFNNAVARLRRLHPNLIEASSDLGATPASTFRRVILPLALPGVAAGSIFTFSLTRGDYIIPQVIGDSTLYIGQVVYRQQGVAGNIPFAAAFSLVPIVVIGLYLWFAKRKGAFDAL